MNLKRFWLFLIALLAMALLVACGGGGSGDAESEADSSSPTTNRPAVATMPVPSFSSVGEQSAITSTMNTAEEAAPEADGPDLVLGERVYDGRLCALPCFLTPAWPSSRSSPLRNECLQPPQRSTRRSCRRG